MKSIKEKIKSDYPNSNILEEELSRVGYRVGFEKGANYVLDEIEKMMPSSDYVLESHTKCKIAIFGLQTIIKQLKN